MSRKVLFVHNGPLYRTPDGQVYGTHFTETVKRRYLLLGDHITALMREAALDAPADRYSPINPENFRFEPVPDLMSPSGRIRNHREAMRRIERAVDETDIVVARIPSLTSRLAVNVARKLGKPYLVECVACNWDALWNHHWKAKLSAPWYFLMQRAVVAQSPYVVYVTSEFLQRRYPSGGKQAAISNVELTPTPNSVLEKRLQRIRSLETRAKPLKLVTVADVSVPYKGQGDVVSILPHLLTAGVDAEYHLIGGGDPERLRKLAKAHGVEQRVIFRGALKHDDVLTMLDDMDIYIQPSRQEGLPRALIEAMSRGLPAIGARTGGIPELLAPERIFRPGRCSEIFDALEICTSSINEQVQDARRNYSNSKNYSEDTLMNKRKEFFDAFLRAHSGSLPPGAN